MESQAEPKNVVKWRGNRRSSFAQEFHASEREKQSERVLISLFKPTTPDQDKPPIESKESPPLQTLQPQKSTCVLTLRALRELKQTFESLETPGQKLDKEGFVRECLKIHDMDAYMSKTEMEHLFMKVDVNNNGLVDWSDFTSFILLQQLAKEDDLSADFASYVKLKGQNVKQVEESSEDSGSEQEDENVASPVIHKCHKGGNTTIMRPSPVIEKIIKLNAIQTYVTCTQDGYLKLWHADSLKLLRTQLNRGGAWISDITAMAQQPLAAFAMDRSVTFYDTGRLSLDVLGCIQNLDNIPISATWVRTLDNDKLLYGDDNGFLNIFNFTDEWGGENPKVAPGVADHLLPGMSEERPWKIHSSWITRLMYLNHSSSLLSCSMDGYLMMLDLEKQRKKWSAKEHYHGVCALAYGRSLNFIATCGMERHINVWNPFTAKIMGTLVGHQAPLVDVVVNDKNNQVISVASDSVIKVWDMRNNKCVQTIYERSNEKSLDAPVICSLFYDQKNCSVVAGGASLDAWRQKGSTASKVKRLCCVLYNPIFQQVVVGEETDSMVTVWDIESGRKTFSFSDGSKSRMSAMSFDFSGRRLLIGGQDGRLSMWNFNNGQHLKAFKGFGQNEISCVACLEEAKVKFVAAGGWNGKVCIWGDGVKEKELVEHVTRGHSDDVTCMVVFPPNCFATGSYDGKCLALDIKKSGVLVEELLRAASMMPSITIASPIALHGNLVNFLKVIVWKIDGMVRCLLQTSDIHKDNSCNPIANLLALPAEKVIIGVSTHGGVYFWKVPETRPIYQTALGHVAQPGPICLGSVNQVLFTSDTKGYVKAWTMKDVNFQKQSADSKLSELFCFRAHHETIVSMIFIEQKKLILTASVSFACRLWTESGVKIGQFGQLNPWDLQAPETWVHKSPVYVNSIPPVQGLESVSSTRSSSRISGSTGTSGRCSSNSRQTSRGSQTCTPQEFERTADKENDCDNPSEETTSEHQGSRYLGLKIADILEAGPAHQRLESWFKPLQTAYNRKLPIKDVIPFGPIIPAGISFVRQKQETVTEKPPSGQARKKSKLQDSPPRLSLPRFRFNQTAQTFSTTVRSESNSPRSMMSFRE